MVFNKIGYDEDGNICQINSETGECKDLPEQSEEQERLQELWDSQETENHCEFEIYYTEDNYWWALPLEARWWYDEGEYLGYGVLEAEKTLKDWLG